jgi:ankyrin repeat protein
VLLQSPQYETPLSQHCCRQSVSASLGSRTNQTALATVERGPAATADPVLAMALLLRRHGVDLDNCTRDGETPLTSAAAGGDAACVAALLAAGAAPHRPNAVGLPPLHCAARSGRLAAVRALLAAGAVADLRAAGGETALRMAAAAGHADVCEALLAAGARPGLAGPPPTGCSSEVRAVLARHSTFPAAARRAARRALAAVGGWRGAFALAAAELGLIAAAAAAAAAAASGRFGFRPR